MPFKWKQGARSGEFIARAHDITLGGTWNHLHHHLHHTPCYCRPPQPFHIQLCPQSVYRFGCLTPSTMRSLRITLLGSHGCDLMLQSFSFQANSPPFRSTTAPAQNPMFGVFTHWQLDEAAPSRHGNWSMEHGASTTYFKKYRVGRAEYNACNAWGIFDGLLLD